LSFFLRAKPLFAAVTLASLFGCANDPAPSEQLKLTEQALVQATAVGATEDQPDMATAQAKLARAQVDMTDKSYKEARVLAEQAELDARLAESRVLTQKSEEQLTQMNTRLNRLRKQLGEAQ
jgi:hypothetical protein